MNSQPVVTLLFLFVGSMFFVLKDWGEIEFDGETKKLKIKRHVNSLPPTTSKPLPKEY